ncbi:hypothetical protein BH10BAC2_BH10BAC2_38650 [soil metagenome]
MEKLTAIKIKPTTSSVEYFINSIADEQKRKNSLVILKLMEKAMKEKPKMWGSSLIGFGDVRYNSSATGKEVDWFKIGFSPRKANLSLHLINLRQHSDAMNKLGKFKTGAGCLYINKLEDVDINVLGKIIVAAAK